MNPDFAAYIILPQPYVFSDIEKQSFIGFGVESNKLLTTNPDLVRTQFWNCINQIQIDTEPVQKKTKTTPAPVSKTIENPLLDQWYLDVTKNYDSGILGLVPECYQNTGVPSKEDLMSSAVGEVLQSFSRFIKKLF